MIMAFPEVLTLLQLLQGSGDTIVPPNQAESILKIIKDRGGSVEYVLFDGEGHGFRHAGNIKKALETEYGFYEKIFNLTPV
jgi:dipeptidyl aminopeptidase/acylaminoacyl peptidase